MYCTASHFLTNNGGQSVNQDFIQLCEAQPCARSSVTSNSDKAEIRNCIPEVTKAPPAVDSDTSESDSDEQQTANKEHNVNQKMPHVPHPPSTSTQSPPTRGTGYHFCNRSLVSPVPSPTAVQPSRPLSDFSATSSSDTSDMGQLFRKLYF